MNGEVRKRLSANDVGDTGAHQAGILVPKEGKILSFFCRLDPREVNPRAAIVVRERGDSTRWEFNFIYYNNRFRGGTRNEYRLTCMTTYLRAVNARAGDELAFTKDENGSIVLECVRAGSASSDDDGDVLVLSGGWKIVEF